MERFNIKITIDDRGEVEIEHPAQMPQNENLAGILEAIAMLCRVGPQGYAGDAYDVATTR